MSERYGATRVAKIRDAFNKLRAAVRSGDLDAAEWALDRYEPWSDFIFDARHKDKSMTVDLKQHLIRQMVFSKGNFGPGARTKGILDHIRKELDEVEEITMPQAGPADGEAPLSSKIAEEWADLVILSLDGLTRAIWAGSDYAIAADLAAELAVDAIVSKQAKNERRDWPDWRKAPADKAIEHVRGTHD